MSDRSVDLWALVALILMFVYFVAGFFTGHSAVAL